MTTGLTLQGRGGRRAPTTLVVLAVISVLVGSLLLALAARGQTPDPPAPPASTTSSDEGPSASDDAPSAGATPTASDTAAPPQPTEDAGATSAPGTVGSVPGPSSTAGAEAPAELTEDAVDEGIEPLPASVPTQVRLPSIEVSSPLHSLGLAADGTLEVPSGERYDEAAWYSGSPTPGEVGPTVIEGHVTGVGGRPSIFFELGALREGDLVEVDREDGTTVTFEVYRVEQYAKDAFPTVSVYGPTPGPELRLITCGGEFDEAAGSHRDNTVAYARAVATDRP